MMTEEPTTIPKGAVITYVQPIPPMHEVGSVFPDHETFFLRRS